MLRPARGLRILTLATALLAAGPSGSAGADENLKGTNLDPRLGPLFQSAVSKASARLQVPECAAIVGDFQDEKTGRLLTDRLAGTGQTASDYFSRWLTYTSGLGLRPCQHSGVMAFTSPGSRVVFVCPDQFRAAWRKSEGNAANTLIHEALHSLGLGENPPDSRTITFRVQRRCGR